MTKNLFALIAICLILSPQVVSAQLTSSGIKVDFTDLSGGAIYDGATIGSSFDLAGSGTSRYLNSSNYNARLHIVDSKAIKVLAGGPGDPQSFETSLQLNQSGSGLGVGGGAAGEQLIDDDDFDFFNGGGDSLSFRLEGVSCDSIVLDEFAFSNLGAGESFTLASDAFIGGGYTTYAGVAFDNDNGVFTFTNNGDGQSVFRLTQETDLDFSEAVKVGDSAVFTLAFAGGAINPGQAHFAGFSFHAVPEPTFIGLLAASGIGFVVHRRRKKKLSEKESV